MRIGWHIGLPGPLYVSSGRRRRRRGNQSGMWAAIVTLALLIGAAIAWPLIVLPIVAVVVIGVVLVKRR